MKFDKIEGPTELSLKLYPHARVMIMSNDYSNEAYYGAYLYHVQTELGNKVIISQEENIIEGQ